MTAIVGIVNLFATLMAVFLMDRAGRLVLFLTSQLGMGLWLWFVEDGAESRCTNGGRQMNMQYKTFTFKVF
jgi:hypothetical protein